MDKFTRISVVLVALLVFGFALVAQSIGRSQEQEKSATNRSVTQPKPPSPAKAPESPQNPSEATWNIPADADKTKNAVPTSEESVAKGKELYFARKANCVFCHGDTGAGNEKNMPDLRRKPADLTNKKLMTSMSDGEIFWKISLGIPGIMPGRERQLTEEERWHVINYIRTLAKEKN